MVDTSTVPDLGSIVGIWAHPDDEAYLSAGLMATAVDAGRRVCCVTATKGELGFPDDDPRSPEQRCALREAELEACLADLGVTDHRWLGYHDGACTEVDVGEAVARLVMIIDEVRPDTVLCFGPDGGTLHPDHIATSRWATIAVRRCDSWPRLLMAAKTPEWVEEFSAAIDPSHILREDGPMPPSTPAGDLVVRTSLPDELAERKIVALRKQASQIEPLIVLAGEQPFFDLMRWEFFREATADDWPGES
jgi:LmbE family N-acetylglucosaminyl deacetylase